MKLLNCTVRLGGDLLHAVPKERISEREVMLLRHIHGSDAVVDLKQVGEIEIAAMDEYHRLARFYGVKKVEECFDVKLFNFQEWLENQLAAEDAQREERRLYDAPAPTAVAQAVENVEQTPTGMSDEEFEAEINRRAEEMAEAKLADLMQLQAEKAQAAQAQDVVDANDQASDEQPEQVVEQAAQAPAQAQVQAPAQEEAKPANKKAAKAETTAINLE